jgi:hypothetical protein
MEDAMSDRYAHATSHLDRSSNFLDRLAEAALAVLASASALYTYQGATTLLTEEADTWWLRSVAAVFAIAVGIGLFAAWSYVLRAAPHLIGFRGRFCEPARLRDARPRHEGTRPRGPRLPLDRPLRLTRRGTGAS